MTAAFQNRLESLGSASAPLSPRPQSHASPRDGFSNGPKIAKVLTAAAWPLAIVLALHRTVVTAFNGTATDDFSTVYNALSRAFTGLPVYDQAYNHVDPLYLYNPGATLLLMPMAAIDDFEVARYLFITVNRLAVVAALALLTHLVGQSLRGPVLPTSIAVAFSTESVINTLTFSNINGVLLLLLAVFLYAFVRSFDFAPAANQIHPLSRTSKTQRFVAGIAIGLAIVIKPQFAPLLFLSVVRLDWRTTVTGIAIPVALNVVAWQIIPGAQDYFTKLMPYLGEPRDYANSSLAGWQAYFDISDALYWPVWLLVAAAVAIGTIVLLRWRTTDVMLWALTTSGLLMVGVFTLSSLGQQYYSMWLFPMIFSVFLPRSVFHSWPAWLAATLFLIPNSWTSTLWPDFGRWMGTYIGTLGWVLLIVATAATALGWWRLQVKNPA